VFFKGFKENGGWLYLSIHYVSDAHCTFCVVLHQWRALNINVNGLVAHLMHGHMNKIKTNKLREVDNED